MPFPAPSRTTRVAVYWDFDNVVLSRFDAVHGRSAWSRAKYSRFSPAEGAKQRMRDSWVELEVVMNYAASLGSVAINRAYADWTPWWMSSYSRTLQEHSVDLVQLFPLSGTKNGADIRLAVDVMEDLHHHPDITDVIVVAGDSDYVSLAQRCRRYGRSFVGVGVRDHTSTYLVAACNEFKYYDVLANEANAAPDEDTVAANPGRARELLVTALDQLLAGSTTGWVKRVALKPVMLRMDPSFDHREFGYDTFTAFLDAHDPEVVCHREIPGEDREYRLSNGVERVPTQPGSASAPDEEVRSADGDVGPGAADRYVVALRAARVVLSIERPRLWSALAALPRTVGGQIFTTARDLQLVLAESMTPDEARDVTVAAMRVGRVFEHAGNGQRLRDTLSGADIRRRVAFGIADRVRLDQGHHLDHDGLLALLFGVEASEEDRTLVREILVTPTVNSYEGRFPDVIPGAALVALLEALAAMSGPILGSPHALRTLFVETAEQVGFALTEDDGADLWNLLYAAGVLRGEEADRVERAIHDVESMTDAVVDLLGRRVTDEGIPADREVIGAAIGLPGVRPPASPVAATRFARLVRRAQ